MFSEAWCSRVIAITRAERSYFAKLLNECRHINICENIPQRTVVWLINYPNRVISTRSGTSSVSVCWYRRCKYLLQSIPNIWLYRFHILFTESCKNQPVTMKIREINIVYHAVMKLIAFILSRPKWNVNAEANVTSFNLIYRTFHFKINKKVIYAHLMWIENLQCLVSCCRSVRRRKSNWELSWNEWLWLGRESILKITAKWYWQ